MTRGYVPGDPRVAHTHLVTATARTRAREHEQPRDGGQHQSDGRPTDPVRHISLVHAFIPRRTSQCWPNYAPPGGAREPATSLLIERRGEPRSLRQAQAVPNDLSDKRPMDTWILWLLTDSTFPATSQDRKRTVVVPPIVNGPVYVGLSTVGVSPLVV